MEKLSPLSEYVLQEEKTLENILNENLPAIKIAASYDRIINYTKFLRQPLTLSMFVPVDEKEKFFKFQFDMNAENAEYFISTFETIEGLAFMYEPELTPSALKIIGTKNQ